MDKRTQSFLEHKVIITQLADMAEMDREGFRLQATCIATLYSPADRQQIRLVASCGLDAYEIVQRWHTDIYPQLLQLDQQRTKNGVQNALIKHLIIDKPEAEKLTSELVVRQQKKIVTAFIDSFLPAPERHIAVLTRLFSQPYDMIASLRQRYLDYLLHTKVAEQSGIVVYDPNSPWPTRRRVARHISAERQHTESLEHNRLLTIDERIEHLSASYDGLLGKIIERDWDLIIIVSLKNKYEMEIQALPASESKSPTRRLAIFEKITKAFRDVQVEKFAQIDNTHGGLRSARLISENVDELLLQIFDLTNTQKNQLLVLIKEARELIAEREDIISKRAHRQQLLKQMS